MAVIDGFPIVQKGGIPDEKSEKNKKTQEDLKNFLDVYDFFKEVPHAIHFRVSTHGNVDEENCHPYKVGESAYLMHNGVLNNFSHFAKGFNDKTKSDTWNFANSIKPFIDKKWMRNESFIRLINIIAGENNRLLFMDPRGFFMPRPDLWTNRAGIYYSNIHGIQFNVENRSNNTNQSWGPHGQGHNHRHQQTQLKPTDGSKNDLFHNFDQNQGHMFFLDGRRAIQLNPAQTKEYPPKETPKILLPSESSTKLVAITSRQVMTPEQVQSSLKTLSFTENIPRNPEEWKQLSYTAIRDLVSEEPEMMADVMWDLVNS